MHEIGGGLMKKKIILVLVLVITGIVLVLLLNGCETKVIDENLTDSDAMEVADGIINGVEGAEVSAAINAGNCDDCHAMEPAVATWKLTSHNKLPCTACHGEKVSNLSDITPSLPVELTDQVKSENCKQCHSVERQRNTSGDLIIYHEKHDKAGISCVQCHSGVAHANITEWESAKEKKFGEPSQWDAKTFEEVVSGYTQLNMGTCLDCHKEMEVTIACSSCHSEIENLPSHETNEWNVTHGNKGRENIDECKKCHSISGEEMFVEPNTGDEIANFARANQFCYKCHMKRPDSHKENILTNHTSLILDKGLANCYTCHNKNQPNEDENTSTTFCNKCHSF